MAQTSSNKKPACVITMVRDDEFFLQRWVDYYGGIFGRDALYVINHGGSPRVADIASGCNVMAIPDLFDEKFDMFRWRLFNGLAKGLRGYYDFVIIGDVDEFLIVDPKTRMDLREFLAKRRKKVTVTPIGLEVVHKPELEPDDIGTGPMLGPRRFVRYSSAYSKPCMFNHRIELSRGGHYASDPNLKAFRNLYLFHMRFLDEGMYNDTLARRKTQMANVDGESTENQISWQWQPKDGQPTAYDNVAAGPVSPDFDMSKHVSRMGETWEKRGDAAWYHFARDISPVLQTLPERFFGLV